MKKKKKTSLIDQFDYTCVPLEIRAGHAHIDAKYTTGQFTSSMNKYIEQSNQLDTGIKMHETKANRLERKINRIDGHIHMVKKNLEKQSKHLQSLTEKYSTLSRERNDLTSQLNTILEKNREIQENIDKCQDSVNLLSNIYPNDSPIHIVETFENCNIICNEGKNEISKSNKTADGILQSIFNSHEEKEKSFYNRMMKDSTSVPISPSYQLPNIEYILLQDYINRYLSILYQLIESVYRQAIGTKGQNAFPSRVVCPDDAIARLIDMRDSLLI